MHVRNSYARQHGTLAWQVDQHCTVREVITTRSHELKSDLEVVSLPDDFSRKIGLLPIQETIERQQELMAQLWDSMQK